LNRNAQGAAHLRCLHSTQNVWELLDQTGKIKMTM